MKQSAYLVIAVLLWFGVAWVLLDRTERRVREPLPSVIVISLTPAKDDPAVCPGEGIGYTLHFLADRDMIVSVDTLIRNRDTRRTEILSMTTRTLVSKGEAIFENIYIVPPTLPATGILSERAWPPGNYERILAVTGIEGLRQSSITYMNFRISEDCPWGVKSP